MATELGKAFVQIVPSATHNVTWSRKDSFCEGQYEEFPQPEEFPTMPVRTQILQLPKPQSDLSFAKFDFDEEEPV